MLPPLVLLAPRVTGDSVTIWRTALAAQWQCERLQNWRIPSHLQVHDRDIIIYAEPLFAEAVTSQLDLALLEPPPEWLPSLPQEYLLRKIEILSLSNAREHCDNLFVKPAEGKVFEPRVYQTGSELPTLEQIGDIKVIASTPVQFELEVRCFVANGVITTSSPYWRNGNLAQTAEGDWPFIENEETEAHHFANDVLQSLKEDVPTAFVLDVGRTSEKQWIIVEGNPCWGAGLYGCNPKEVLNTIRLAIRPKTSITAQEQRWVTKTINNRRLN